MGKVVQLGAYAEAEGQPPEDHCRHDPFFLPPGAEAFKRDNPNAVVRFFDTGHFALETHAREIAESIRDFLK
jgi:pimeloyl-ACP methyl ester carboxylesterase